MACQRFQNQRKLQIYIGGVQCLRWAEPARLRYRQFQALRQILKPRLINQVFDKCRVGKNKAEYLLQALAMAG